MDNYLIRYDNSVNKMFPVGLSKLEMNTFMYILSEFTGNSVVELIIPYRRLREIIKYNPRRTSKEFDEVLEKLCDKLRQVTLSMGNDEEDADYCVFPTFIRNWYEQSLTVGINLYAKKLLDIQKGYTQFDIREFISLKSKAATFIFINLKQFRTTGVWHVGMNDFKKGLGASTYSNNNCIQKLIIPAVKELNEKEIFDDLTFKTETDSSKGNPVRALLFTFAPEKRKVTDKSQTVSSAKSENAIFRDEKRENVPLDPRKSDTEHPAIEIDSMYCTAEALLGGRINEEGIGFISREAKRCRLTPLMLKRCVYNALGRDNVGNLVGYIVTLIRKSGDQPRTQSIVRTENSFHNLHERRYDYDALMKEALGQA